MQLRRDYPSLYLSNATMQSFTINATKLYNATNLNINPFTGISLY